MGDGLVSEEYSPLGDVSRRMDEVVQRMESLALRIETTYVRFDLFEASKQLNETERLQLSTRLDKMESRSEWLIRTVGGVVVSGILGLVVALTRAKTGV
jgi:hypothetical protein